MSFPAWKGFPFWKPQGNLLPSRTCPGFLLDRAAALRAGCSGVLALTVAEACAGLRAVPAVWVDEPGCSHPSCENRSHCSSAVLQAVLSDHLLRSE